MLSRRWLLTAAVAALLLVLVVASPAAAQTPTEHVAAADFDLASGNDDGRGIDWDGTYFRVVDRTDDKVYSYNSGGSHVASADFDLASGNDDGRGIDWDGTYFRVVDRTDDKVYSYNSGGIHVASADFGLAIGNDHPSGIDWDCTYFRVADYFDDKVYSYNSGGIHVAAADFDLASGNDDGRGIDWDGTYFRVADQVDDKVYSYNSGGSHVASADFDLASENDAAYRIDWDGTYFRVVDYFDGKVYSYGTGEAPSFIAGTALRTVPAGSGVGADVGDPVVAIDPQGDTLTYALSGTDQASFAIDSDGQITVDTSSLGSDGTTYEVTVTATDPDSNTASIDVTITVGAAPSFAAMTYSRSVPENSPVGTNLGEPVMATDPNSAAVTYSLSGSGSATFLIGEHTGQISVGGGRVGLRIHPQLFVHGDGHQPRRGAGHAMVLVSVTDVSVSGTWTRPPTCSCGGPASTAA